MAYLVHYGTKRHSGRYPWGSGEDPHQRTPDFRAQVLSLKKKGMSEKDIAAGFGMSIKDMKSRITREKAEDRQHNMTKAMMLKEKGYSTTEIGRMMGKPESTIRSYLDPAMQEKAAVLKATTNMLKQQLSEKPYLDIGAGVELDIGVKRPKLDAAINELTDNGYKVQYVDIEQLGTGKMTTMKVLTKDDVTKAELVANKDKIRTIANWSEDDGLTYIGTSPVKSIDSKRVMVRFDEDGGSDMDGVIQLRRGVPDLSLGDKRYAQVRIEVDDKYYMKGMAIYSNDIPDGVDVVYNSTKSKEVGKYGAFKPNETDDPTNPFGAAVRQTKYIDKDGNEQVSLLNKVGYSSKIDAGEEGYWDTWKSGKNLSSQFLSKQNVDVADEQLQLAVKRQREDFETIKQITNPAVKQRLMDSFADDCDSKAVNLDGASLKGQSSRVILPVKSLKDDEVYAPSYKNGQEVILVRYPHAGTFEIPRLKVNNKNVEAVDAYENSKDMVGINPRVAAKMSGADFDGDSVVVIPYNKRLKVSDSLEGLKNFNPKIYKDPNYDKITDREKNMEMGKVSNLITDMTIKGASTDEIARAVRHSMVVIDSKKHNLNYKQSAIDNGIAELKKTYQGAANAGASTLLSRAGSKVFDAPATRPLKKGDPGYEDVVRKAEYSVNKLTGEKVFATVEPKTWIDKNTGELRTGSQKKKSTTQMYEAKDARDLMSKNPEPIERVYAKFANQMKAMGDEARLESTKIKPIKYSPSAKAAYADEVRSLEAKLNVAKRNAPLERQAQLLANTKMAAIKRDNPDLTAAQIKKLGGKALETARLQVGAGKKRIEITEREWDAIQSGAISNNKLTSILNNSKIEDVQKLATPRQKSVIPAAKVTRAKAMLKRGLTIAEVAEALGISTSSVSKLA